MSRLLKWVLLPLVLASALWVAQPNTADAHPRHRCGYGGYSTYYGPSYYSRSYFGYRPSYGYRYNYIGPGFSYSFGFPSGGFYPFGW